MWQAVGLTVGRRSPLHSPVIAKPDITVDGSAYSGFGASLYPETLDATLSIVNASVLDRQITPYIPAPAYGVIALALRLAKIPTPYGRGLCQRTAYFPVINCLCCQSATSLVFPACR